MRATPIAPSPVVLEKPRLRLADYQRMNGWQRQRALERWLEENPRPAKPPPEVYTTTNETKPPPEPLPPIAPSETPQAVFERLLKVLEVEQYDVVGPRRTPKLIEAREIIAAIMRAYRPHGVPVSYPEIARIIRNAHKGGGRHSTIITAIYRWALNSDRFVRSKRVAAAAGLSDAVCSNLDMLRDEVIRLLEGRNNRGTLHWVLPKAYVSPHG